MSRVGGEARSRYDDDWYDELPIATDESKRRRKTVSRYSSRSGLLRTEDAPGRFDGSRFTDSMVAGALAGLAVDGALFPMDTLKTRLQSPAGFRASGGFANLYRGIGVCLMGSAPCSALFFSTFEAAHGPIERALAAAGASPPAAASALAGGGEARFGTEMWFGGVNALAAAGELVASTLRVPVEALKQRLQTGQPPGRLWAGWSATLCLRDGANKFPLNSWSYLLSSYARWLLPRKVTAAFESPRFSSRSFILMLCCD